MYLKSRVKIPDVHGKLDSFETWQCYIYLSMSMIVTMLLRRNTHTPESNDR